MGDGLILMGDFGTHLFPNMQKYYKFQLLCDHPAKYVYIDGDHFEEMCYRCRACIRRWKKDAITETSESNWFDDKL